MLFRVDGTVDPVDLPLGERIEFAPRYVIDTAVAREPEASFRISSDPVHTVVVEAVLLAHVREAPDVPVLAEDQTDEARAFRADPDHTAFVDEHASGSARRESIGLRIETKRTIMPTKRSFRRGEPDVARLGRLSVAHRTCGHSVVRAEDPPLSVPEESDVPEPRGPDIAVLALAKGEDTPETGRLELLDHAWASGDHWRQDPLRDRRSHCDVHRTVLECSEALHPRTHVVDGVRLGGDVMDRLPAGVPEARRSFGTLRRSRRGIGHH